MLLFLHQLVEQVVSIFEGRDLGRGLLAFVPAHSGHLARLAVAAERCLSLTRQKVRRIVPEATCVSSGSDELIILAKELQLVSRWFPCVVSFHGRRIVDKIHHWRATDKVMIFRLEHGARVGRQTGLLAFWLR